MKFVIFTRLVLFWSLLVSALATQAQVLSPSGVEVKFNYTTTFQAPDDHEYDTEEELANFHASHIFGLFSSPTMISKYLSPRAVTGGLGGPRTQMKIKIISSEDNGDGTLTVTYSNSGKMLLNKIAANKILKNGKLTLPMPSNPYEIYNEKCTDPHYDSFGDYWYFYDIFRLGCEYLSRSPYATKVEIKVAPADYKKIETSPRLPILRGNNDNGDLFSIYIISGYYEETDKNDPGHENFNEIRLEFEKRGFDVSKKRPNSPIPLNLYTKTITLDNGQKVQVEVKHLLVDTGIETRSKTFAKFFKEAVKEADVIVYGGHSGLGANLDIPSLEEKAGTFEFNTKKKQIFFFDSCSSYSYYLEHFAVEKTKAKIDIISYGLSSYFHTSTPILFQFLDYLFIEQDVDVDWIQILKDMEKPIQGDTYLLNVGGI